MNETGNREETLFNQAMGLPTPEARAAFLKQACAGNDQRCHRICMKARGHLAPLRSFGWCKRARCPRAGFAALGNVRGRLVLPRVPNPELP